MSNDADYDWVAVLDRMCRNAAIRRELLWLRAKETADQESARDLREIEPGLVEHTARLVEDFLAQGHCLDTPEQEREGFALLYEERFEHWARILTSGSAKPRS